MARQCLVNGGLADLLDMKHASLQSVTVNWPPKELTSFIDKAQGMKTKLIKVVAKNSPHKGRNIVVYDSEFIESLMRAYALAFVHGKLRLNQNGSHHYALTYKHHPS